MRTDFNEMCWTNFGLLWDKQGEKIGKYLSTGNQETDPENIQNL